MTSKPVTSERPPFVFWACLWGLGLSFTIAGLAIDMVRQVRPPGRDFANLYAAGKLALDGHGMLAFDVTRFRQEIFVWTGYSTPQNYSYPPHALLVAMPFALLPYWISLATWTVIGAGFFLWVARRSMPFAPALAILTPAAGLTLWNGHYGFFLGGLWLLFFRYLPRAPRRAGAAAAMLTIKPHMGLLIAAAALTRRAAFMWAVAFTLLMASVSLLLFGSSSWEAFAVETAATQAEILTRAHYAYYFLLMPTTYVALGRGSLAVAAHLAVVAATIFMLARRPTLDPFALATATFLILPYAFSYDMTVACLGFAIILYRDWAALKLWRRAALSLAFLVPTLTFIVAPLVPLALLGALWIQLERADPIERPLFLK